MSNPTARARSASYLAGAAAAVLLAYGLGHRFLEAGPPVPEPAAPQQQQAAPARPPALRPARSVPAPKLLPDRNVETVVEAQRKRVMGRVRSLEMVRRVATEIRPHVDRAADAPEHRETFAALARAAGMPVGKYKEYFKSKQEADLLLESGGDPEAHSVADAIGVAQFLAGTARNCGLKVDLAASRSLSGRIAALDRQIREVEKQPDGWTRPVPPALRGVVPAAEGGPRADASQLPMGGAESGVWNRDQWLAHYRGEREKLAAQRRRADERYDPARAIAAQTRYLLRLTRRYGGVDWALQAYHGGEGGASRTMGLFTNSSASRTLLASRRGALDRPGAWLPYADLYWKVTPQTAPGAFGYLFGRSDDHRYYWWKVLMAEQALDRYREDPRAFEREWEGLRPGYSADIAWHPETDKLQFADNRAVERAYAAGDLVRLPAGQAGLRTHNLASLEPESAALFKGLRPEAMGTLLRLNRIYRHFGGKGDLTVMAMVQPLSYREKWEARYPPEPLPPNVPRDPDMHATGLVFDLRRPESDWERKVLEYALGVLYDSLRISWRTETAGGSRRYHVVVNPAHADEMRAFYQQAISEAEGGR